MKNVIWLIIVALTQSFSTKAMMDNSAIHPYALPVTSKPSTDLYFSERIHYAGEPEPSFRINLLTIKSTPKGVLLNWMVEETANLQYFLIEHAVDGQNFSPLFEVPVQVSQQAYSFVDAEFKNYDKTVYYRVKAIYPTVVIESPVRKLAPQVAKR